MIKREVIAGIIDREGGYVNDPADSGGETNYGITVAAARECGYPGRMDCMPRTFAFRVYAGRYWDSVRADDLLDLSEKIAEEVVDTGVNMGVARSSTFLQRALNALNSGGALYQDLTLDGDIGPATIAALREYLRMRDESTLLKALNCLQGAAYIELAERREKDERFLYGWLKQRVGL